MTPTPHHTLTEHGEGVAATTVSTRNDPSNRGPRMRVAPTPVSGAAADAPAVAAGGDA